MFYWAKYRCQGNTAGYKRALNNGLDLFLENPVIRVKKLIEPSMLCATRVVLINSNAFYLQF